ncbi:hypothetical protein CKA32_003547 [Geitlerinema sp. FC II]|nr:hypothetical protein CKA32_003547 [Geitlerinema sp. FC II]
MHKIEKFRLKTVRSRTPIEHFVEFSVSDSLCISLHLEIK